ncbi:MAG TPA: hypothetical protein DHW07_07385 [Gammaproteobacteria bacterium]|nr:hypothetical protein [Gammaproteobacteria bacterium]|tara:strand:- start:139 stop:726 length:588 start_codon:yes stop_codon:yes gene_type:complete
MHVFFNSLFPRVSRFWLAVFSVGVLSLPAVPVMADFTVSEGKSVLIDNQIKTSARLNLDINGEPEVALSKGIALTLLVKSHLYRASLASWHFKIGEWEDRLLLEHHSLSNRYTLTISDSSITEDFATLTETLDFLGQYTKTVALPDGVSANDALQMRLQVSLSRSDLPGPLKLVALFLKDWRIGSDWERWKVTIP